MSQVIAVCQSMFFVIAIVSWLGAEKVQAGGLIEFPNLEQGKPAQLSGYLARPDQGLPAYLGGRATGAGPYPAVVVLHGCSGFSSHNTNTADQIASWGYVALAIDSLSPRRIVSRCSGPAPLADQALDAYAALRYLSRLEFVDPTRVAVLGESMGGFSALQVVEHDFATQHSDRQFRAAIAYYPICRFPRGGDGTDFNPDRRAGRHDPGGKLPSNGREFAPWRRADQPDRLSRSLSRIQCRST